MNQNGLGDLKKQLFQAVSDNNLEEIKKILSLGVDTNIKDDIGRAPIHLATAHANLEIVEMLASFGADLNIKSDLGHTALYSAVSINSLPMVKTLLARGADTNIRSENSLPIHLAASKGNLLIFEELLTEETVNERDRKGFTPLHLAVEYGRIGIVKVLIDCPYVEINIPHNVSGDTALILAAKFEYVKIAKLLLEQGADYDLKNKDGETFFKIVTDSVPATCEVMKNMMRDIKLFEIMTCSSLTINESHLGLPVQFLLSLHHKEFANESDRVALSESSVKPLECVYEISDGQNASSSEFSTCSRKRLLDRSNSPRSTPSKSLDVSNASSPRFLVYRPGRCLSESSSISSTNATCAESTFESGYVSCFSENTIPSGMSDLSSSGSIASKFRKSLNTPTSESSSPKPSTSRGTKEAKFR